MQIADFDSVVEVATHDQLEQVLARRFQHGENEFWLSRIGGKYPAMSITALNDLATLQYFPTADGPGFRSIGGTKNRTSGDLETFYIK